ncbi:MAG: hypothetical protein WCP14_04410 [bacterium]
MIEVIALIAFMYFLPWKKNLWASIGATVLAIAVMLFWFYANKTGFINFIG